MTIRSFLLVVVSTVAAITLSPNPRSSRAAAVCDSPIATMVSVQGDVVVLKERLDDERAVCKRFDKALAIGPRLGFRAGQAVQ